MTSENEDVKGRPLKVELLSKNSKISQDIFGFFAYKSGLMDPIIKEKDQTEHQKYSLLMLQYKEKIKAAKVSGRYSDNFAAPEKKNIDVIFGEFYQELLQRKKKDTNIGANKLIATIDKREYCFQSNDSQNVTFQMIQDMPDTVFILVDGRDEGFKSEFIDDSSLKGMLIMHMFLGTQRIYFCPYFDYLDPLLRHKSHQTPLINKIHDYYENFIEFLGN